jgi:hypothetical protein
MTDIDLRGHFVKLLYVPTDARAVSASAAASSAIVTVIPFRHSAD